VAGLSDGGAVSRIKLRRAKKSDLLLIAPWYEEAALVADGGLIPDDEPTLDDRFGEGNLWVIESDAPIGLLEGVTEWPAEDWATVEWLALAAEQRGWGYGSEAVRQFEARHKAASFLAQIAARNGLALYFWLRMGYRPARADEVFWRDPDESGIIAMIRLPQ
jgi:GNAT superfamily N-acetyltransferase